MIGFVARQLEAYSPEKGIGRVTAAEVVRWPYLAVPELGNGFVYNSPRPTGSLGPEVPGVSIRSIRVDLPEPGNYRVRLVVSQDADGGPWQLFAANRRLVHVCTEVRDMAVKQTLEFSVNLSDIIPDTLRTRKARGGLSLTLAGQGANILEGEIEPAEVPTIHLAGDSTVTDQGADLPYRPGVSYAGWGQALPALFGPGVAVANHAHGGLTVDTFRSGGHWEILQEGLLPGDFVLLQFGHNDQKRPELRARSRYREGLQRYLREVRVAGATPVLVTPLARNSWRPDGTYNDLLAPYAAVVRELAAQEQVPLLDLHAAFGTLLQAMGREESKSLFYPGDFTHTNDYGALSAARIVAGALCKNMDPLLAPLRAALTPELPTWLPGGNELALRVRGWFAPPPPKVAPLAGDGGEPLSRLEALALAQSAFGFFAVNPEPGSDESGLPEPVRVARQNGYWPREGFETGDAWLASPVQAGELREVFFGAASCRAEITPELTERLPLPAGGEITKAQGRAIAAALEAACLGTDDTIRRPGIKVRGS